MSQVIAALEAHALRSPMAIAVDAGARQLNYRDLWQAVVELSATLRRQRLRTVGVYADNGLAWALADLAALHAGLRVLPLPLFFSLRQLRHATASAGVDAVLVDPALSLPWTTTGAAQVLGAGGESLHLHRLNEQAVMLPPATQKITFTSGTTAAPKGVCLGVAAMDEVAAALCEASGADAGDRHLCVLPLPTLLENLGGLYAPLLAGATVCLRPSADVGLDGAASFDPQRCLALMHETGATTVILVPQLLMALVHAIELGAARPPRLRFVAVGGAPVSPRLLAAAAGVRLPVFEGYGLSECASVVALNTPRANRPGSAGRPLAQRRVRIDDAGEIHVAGGGFLGYVGHASRDPAADVATGDLGHFDSDGFLHITGRCKNLFITAFGRNVAPEWIERELCLQPCIAQAAVFGEGRAWNVAVIVPRPGTDATAIDRAIESCNRELPDYARVHRWLRADAPFTVANEQMTTNGRWRRAQIESHYRARIEATYEEECCHAVS
jgi:long-chain acyl-CoA synthetase